jgi:cupin fold WbuC family metalloprotein
MIAVRGLLTLILFDERGNISEAVAFGTESTRTDAGEAPSVGVQIPPGVWHTVVANRPHSILFEAKAGPFDPASPKEFAPWAPEEGGGEACAYLLTLKRFCASAS